MANVLTFPSENVLEKGGKSPPADENGGIKRKIHISGKVIHFTIAPEILSRFKLSAGWIAANLGRAIENKRDSKAVGTGLTTGGGTLSLAFDGNITGPVGFNPEELKVIIHPKLSEVRHRGIAAAFMGAAAAVLLAEAYGESVSFPKTRLEEAAKLFLLLLAENLPAAGEVNGDDLSENLSVFLSAKDPLYKLILGKFSDLSSSPVWHNYVQTAQRTRVFLFPAAFGRLEQSEKRSALMGGILAWHDFLLFGLLRLLPFINGHPYFLPARMVLRGWIGEKDLFTGGAARRLKRALGKGRVVKATEAFWAGWNPRLTAIILKPIFRMLGGNKRPLTATIGTF
ncbi:MAG: hypothetical protein ACYS8W_12800, partial [Planctomycetota bacterium]